MPDPVTPFILDLDALTQEQFDRAMEHAGTCSYNAPCIIGAMMSPELLAKIRETGRDKASITNLAVDGLVTFPDDSDDGIAPQTRAYRVQSNFDQMRREWVDEWDDRLDALAELLPHIDVAKHKLPTL